MIIGNEKLSYWCDGYLQPYLLTEEAWDVVRDFLAAEGLSELNEEHMAMLVMLATLADWDQALADNGNPEQLKNNFPLLLMTIDDGVIKIYRLTLMLEENRMQPE